MDYDPEWRKIRAQRNYDYVNGYKLDTGCEDPDCKWEGEFHPTQLHFDHIDPSTKYKSIAFLCKNGRSLDVIQCEMSKCVVRCANCHAKKTYIEGEHNGVPTE